jgi:hypothetical protein
MTLFQGSRYQRIPLFDPDAEGRGRFAGLRQRPTGPAIGVLEHAVETGDRLDRLAFHYFGEPRLWYRLVEANPDVLFPEDLVWSARDADFAPAAGERDLGRERVGAQILIPRAREG